MIAHGPASRPALGSQTNLSKQTVSLATAELENLGFCEVTTSQQGPLGRAAAIYDVAASAGWLLGVDLGSTHVRVTASSLTGVPLLEREHEVEGAPNKANANLGEQAGAIIAPLIAELSATHGPLRSSCVALSRAVPTFRDWQGSDDTDSDIPRIVRQLRIPDDVPVFAENNVNCAALGESRYGGARGLRHVCYLQIGVGLGAGLITDGVLMRGSRGQAGELRYVPASGIGADAPGLDAERWLRSEALIARYNGEREDEGEGPADTSAEILERAARGHPIAVRVVDAEARGIAHLVAALNAVSSPELVILGGGIGAVEGMRVRVANALQAIGLSVPLTGGELGTSATVAGAAALAAECYLHALLSPHSVHALSTYESRWSR